MTGRVSPLMANIPIPVSKQQLLAALDDIRAHVAANDSLEGYLEYSLPWAEEIGDPETDGREVDFRLKAGYRTGNRHGQGGFRMIGKIE